MLVHLLSWRAETFELDVLSVAEREVLGTLVDIVHVESQGFLILEKEGVEFINFFCCFADA